tara:strand:- start:37 stop:768 length:732 start_codon:yes stop_codon:yes gene_type:complete
MDKQKLNGFIDKYSLGGGVESVKWNVSKEEMRTNFVSDDKTLLGNVKYKGIGFTEGDYCIYTTSQLKKLISVLDTDIQVLVNHQQGRNYSIGMTDSTTMLEYILSEEAIIPKAPKLKQIPEFTATIVVDGNFVSRFIRAKAALSEESNFTVVADDFGDKLQVIIGHSTSMATNKIIFDVTNANTEVPDLEHISFSADHMKEILLANRDMTSGLMEVSPDGLARVTIEGPDFKSVYYLVQTQNN